MILHITEQSAWKEAIKEGIYQHETLSKEGFIHCSEINQIIPVANYNFKFRSDLVLLCIDNNKVESEV